MSRLLALGAIGAALLLVGCSGGGKKTAAPTAVDAPPGVSPTTTSIGGTTVTAALPGATTTTAGSGRGPGGAATTAAAGKAKLQGAMLTAQDVGPGYVQGPVPGDDDSVAKCMPDNPMAAATDPDEVDSPLFTKGPSDASIEAGSSGRVGPSDAVATDFITRFGGQPVRDCLAQEIKDSLGVGATVQATAVSVTGGDQATGMRVKGSAAAGAYNVDLFALVVRRGSSVAFVQHSSAGDGKPAPTITQDEAVRLARIVAGRM